jgi:hypothetical protein
VVTRTHYLPGFSRLGDYPREALEAEAWGTRRGLFEYWGHEASLLPLQMQPLLRWRMERAKDGAMWTGLSRFGREKADYIDGVLAEIEGSLAGADRILLDIDCDVFDPAFFPATGRPVPAGLSPLDVLRVLGCIPLEKLAGVVLSEFDPGRDQTDRSLGLIVWLLEATLLARHELRWHTH